MVKQRPMRFDSFVAKLRKEGFVDDMTAYQLTRDNHTYAKKELIYQTLIVEMCNRSKLLQLKLFELLPEDRRDEIFNIISEAETIATAFSEGKD